GAHSLAVAIDGSLWAWGLNDKGQLGRGNVTNSTVPIKILSSGVAAVSAGFESSLFLKTDGTLWAMGMNDNGQLGDGTTVNRFSPVQIATSVASFSMGAQNCFFIK